MFLKARLYLQDYSSCRIYALTCVVYESVLIPNSIKIVNVRPLHTCARKVGSEGKNLHRDKRGPSFVFL